MSVKEVNFTFNGLHCLRDFGCIYIETGKTRIVSPITQRNAYAIAGVSGTVLLGDRETHDAYKLSGVLVPMRTPSTLQAAQALARRISAWLKAGRGVLCWDYEPFQQHDAEVTGAISWDTKTWMDGGVAFDFLVQPYAFDLTPTVKRATLLAGTNTLWVPVSTVVPCPVSIELTNTGSTSITRVRIATLCGQVVELGKGMALEPGAVLRLEMKPPIGATVTTGTATVNALRYAVQFDQLTLSGPEALTIALDGTASVTASARGWML